MMRQKFTPDMMMEEVAIAVTTGRCPRCGRALEIHMDEIETVFTCPGCRWVTGGSHSFFAELF